MISDPQTAPPTVPTLERQKVLELVAYAEQYVLLIQGEQRELRRLNRDSSDLLPVIQGWEFMSKALRDSYGLEETEDSR